MLHPHKRKAMRFCMLVMSMACCIRIGGTAWAQDVDKPRQNSVSVKGSASISVQPDTVYIILYVTGEGILGEDAVKNANSKADEVKNALTKAFPKLKSVSAAAVKLGEKSSRVYRSDETTSPPRPEAINRLMITVDAASANDTPKTIDTALRAGAVLNVASDVHYAGDLGSAVYYGVADAKKSESEARAKAIDNAREKAADLAKMAGATVGDIISISDEASVYEYDSSRLLRGKLPVRYCSSVKEPVEVGAGLRVTFELKK